MKCMLLFRNRSMSEWSVSQNNNCWSILRVINLCIVPEDFYRTPLYPDTGLAEDDVVSQFKKRTVNKFKSAFAYYSLTYKLAHLQHLLFLDMMLNKDSIGSAVEEAEAVSKGIYLKSWFPRIIEVCFNSTETRAIYIPRMMTKRVPGALLSWAIPTAHR